VPERAGGDEPAESLVQVASVEVDVEVDVEVGDGDGSGDGVEEREVGVVEQDVAAAGVLDEDTVGGECADPAPRGDDHVVIPDGCLVPG